MTANEMIPSVGQAVLVNFDQINIACIIRDVKTSYGRVRLLVEPISGVGQQWVEISRLRDLKPAQEQQGETR
jgi:hypothetical protein